MNGHTVFTVYCTAVGYGPYLHDDKPDCVTSTLMIFLPCSHSKLNSISSESIYAFRWRNLTLIGKGPRPRGSHIWHTEYSFRGRHTRCIFFWMILSKTLLRPPTYLLLTKSRRILPHKWSGCTKIMNVNLSVAFNLYIPMVPYQIVWPLVLLPSTQLVYMERQPNDQVRPKQKYS